MAPSVAQHPASYSTSGAKCDQRRRRFACADFGIPLGWQSAHFTVCTLWRLAIGESRVHLLDVKAAVGKARMAGCAGCARLLAVLEVARQAAQTFVHAQWSAVVTGTSGAPGKRSMALVAERLARVGTGLDGARAVEDRGKRQQIDGEVLLLAAVVERNRRTRVFAAVAAGLLARGPWGAVRLRGGPDGSSGTGSRADWPVPASAESTALAH